MSKYGDDHRGTEKERLFSDLVDFLEEYGAAELMRIVADAMEEAGK